MDIRAAKTAALQARFPTLNISVGYIGNIYGQIGTPACRDDRSFRIFTNLKDRFGYSINVEIDDTLDFDVEEVSLTLQNIIVHRARMERREDAASCPCTGCVIGRVRRETLERVAEKAGDAAMKLRRPLGA